MDRTITLRLPNTPARGEIARHAALALAVKAGLPPLAADRAAGDVARAVTAIDADEVTIVATLSESSVLLEITDGGHAGDGALTLRLERTPLRRGVRH
jgi:hypothetical protein